MRMDGLPKTSVSRSALRRRPANVTLDPLLVQEARKLQVNVSAACQEGLTAAVRRARAAQWRQENDEAIRSWNDLIEAQGLPLASKRLF